MYVVENGAVPDGVLSMVSEVQTGDWFGVEVVATGGVVGVGVVATIPPTACVGVGVIEVSPPITIVAGEALESTLVSVSEAEVIFVFVVSKETWADPLLVGVNVIVAIFCFENIALLISTPTVKVTDAVPSVVDGPSIVWGNTDAFGTSVGLPSFDESNVIPIFAAIT